MRQVTYIALFFLLFSNSSLASKAAPEITSESTSEVVGFNFATCHTLDEQGNETGIVRSIYNGSNGVAYVSDPLGYLVKTKIELLKEEKVMSLTYKTQLSENIIKIQLEERSGDGVAKGTILQNPGEKESKAVIKCFLNI